MYLLVEYVESSVNLNCTHSHCLEVHDDYYNPVVVCETKEQLLMWLDENRHGTLELNGDTVYMHVRNWQGESKYTDVFYILPVELGKALVY